MRRGQAAALGVGLLLVAGVGGTLLAQARLDPEAIRRAVIASVERQSGRTVTLGRLDVRLLPSPHVSADALTLGDRSGAADPVMLRIGHLEAGIGLWPLLRHVVRLNGLTLDQVTLHVLRGADGVGNWEMGPKPAAAGGSGISRGGARWGVVFDDVRIDALRLLFRDELKHRGADLHLADLLGSGLQGEQPRFSLSGAQGHAGFAVQGKVGPIRRLLDVADRRTEWPVSIGASETIGGVVVGRGHADGTITDPAHGRGYDLTVGATIGRLTDLDRLFSHANLPSIESLDASAHVVDAGHPEAVALQVRAGPTVLPGMHDLAVRGWNVRASGPDVPVEIAASGSWHGQAAALSGTAATLEAVQAMRPGASMPVLLSLGLGPARLKVAGKIGPAARSGPVEGAPPWRLLRVADADLTLLASDLLIEGQHYRNFSTHAVLQDGRLSMQPIQANGPAGPIAARLQLDAAASPPTLSLWMHPVMLPAETLVRLLGGSETIRGTVELVGDVQAAGASWPQLATSAGGHAGASMTDGTIANAALLRLIGRSSALAAALPANGETAVRCVALHAVLGGGQAAIDTLSLRTGPLSIDGHGRVALADGSLEMPLLANVSLGSAHVSLPVRLGGSLHDPRPALDNAGPGGRFALTIGGSGGGQGDAAADCDGPLRLAREGIAGPAAGIGVQAVAGGKRRKPRAIDILRGLGILR